MVSYRKLLVGTVAGAGLGLLAQTLYPDSPSLLFLVKNVSGPAGQIFLRLLFLLVIPLLFSAVVMGLCELELGQLGKMGVRMLGYTVGMSTVAVLIGLTAVNLLKPGVGLDDRVRQLARQGFTAKPPALAADTSPASLLVSMVPDNAIKAAASGDMLGVILFSVAFGLALGAVKTEGARRLREVIQGLNDVMMKLIDAVLKLAPVGVGALLFTTTARLGFEVLKPVAAYVGVVLLSLAIHQFIVYSLSVRFLGGLPPLAFFRDVRLAMVTAFSTASSSATLPTALKVAEENLKLPRQVSRFVLTAGASMNQNGTALFEGVTVLFLAQLFGVELGLFQQVLVMGICILAGVGTAGVPAGSLPVIAMILGMFDIPPEGLGLILGVDRLLDMCRTTLNVTGDLAAAVYVAQASKNDAEVVASAEAPLSS